MKITGPSTSIFPFHVSDVRLPKPPLSDEIIDQMDMEFSWQSLPHADTSEDRDRFMGWMLEIEFATWENCLELKHPYFPPLKLVISNTSGVRTGEYLIKSRNLTMRRRRPDHSKVFFLYR